MRTLHDGASGEASFAPTLPAAKNTWATGVTIGLTARSTVSADEASTPSCSLEICRARSFIWEQPLEFRKRLRKRQIISLKHVNCHGRSRIPMLNILPVAGVCDNRISMVY